MISWTTSSPIRFRHKLRSTSNKPPKRRSISSASLVSKTPNEKEVQIERVITTRKIAGTMRKKVRKRVKTNTMTRWTTTMS